MRLWTVLLALAAAAAAAADPDELLIDILGWRKLEGEDRRELTDTCGDSLEVPADADAAAPAPPRPPPPPWLSDATLQMDTVDVRLLAKLLLLHRRSLKKKIPRDQPFHSLNMSLTFIRVCLDRNCSITTTLL